MSKSDEQRASKATRVLDVNTEINETLKSWATNPIAKVDGLRASHTDEMAALFRRLCTGSGSPAVELMAARLRADLAETERDELRAALKGEAFPFTAKAALVEREGEYRDAIVGVIASLADARKRLESASDDGIVERSAADIEEAECTLRNVFALHGALPCAGQDSGALRERLGAAASTREGAADDPSPLAARDSGEAAVTSPKASAVDSERIENENYTGRRTSEVSPFAAAAIEEAERWPERLDVAREQERLRTGDAQPEDEDVRKAFVAWCRKEPHEAGFDSLATFLRSQHQHPWSATIEERKALEASLWRLVRRSEAAKPDLSMLHYACQCCATPIGSSGLCAFCSKAWGMGRDAPRPVEARHPASLWAEVLRLRAECEAAEAAYDAFAKKPRSAEAPVFVIGTVPGVESLTAEQAKAQGYPVFGAKPHIHVVTPRDREHPTAQAVDDLLEEAYRRRERAQPEVESRTYGDEAQAEVRLLPGDGGVGRPGTEASTGSALDVQAAPLACSGGAGSSGPMRPAGDQQERSGDPRSEADARVAAHNAGPTQDKARQALSKDVAYAKEHPWAWHLRNYLADHLNVEMGEDDLQDLIDDVEHWELLRNLPAETPSSGSADAFAKALEVNEYNRAFYERVRREAIRDVQEWAAAVAEESAANFAFRASRLRDFPLGPMATESGEQAAHYDVMATGASRAAERIRARQFTRPAEEKKP